MIINNMIKRLMEIKERQLVIEEDIRKYLMMIEENTRDKKKIKEDEKNIKEYKTNKNINK